MRRVQVKSLASSMRPGIGYISGQKENYCHLTIIGGIHFKVGSVCTVTFFSDCWLKCGKAYVNFAGEALFKINVFVNLISGHTGVCHVIFF